MGWSQERLENVARTRLNGAKLIVVANREPYSHRFKNGKIEWKRPAGGLTTALDPVMRACGGTWIGHGSGDADRDVVDANSRVAVPPNDPSYTLRRVWLTKEQEEGYYNGFANSSFWPMCHQVYCKPTFEPAHWQAYQDVNAIFAEAVLEEAQGGPALVFVQDYHFALLPKLLKQARPDLVVAQFWHIPWPNSETFHVCPWSKELIEGMLGNDLLSFHIQHHCNNFLETVDRTVECRIDREHFAVERNEHKTMVRPHAISVDPNLAEKYLGDNWEERAAAFREQYKLGDRALLLGVDRVDYTKGIPERLRGLDWLLEHHPEWHGKFHFLQVGAPSRTDIATYRDLNEEVRMLAEKINLTYGTPDWQPVIFLNEQYGPQEITLLYRMATACVVSSLHDGMNLVAKEFVSARPDEQGSLILSRFTGAARELHDAIIVNPFAVQEMAEAMVLAFTMPADEQRRRMRKMRQRVEEHNIFRWAGRLLSEVGKMVEPMEESLDSSDSAEIVLSEAEYEAMLAECHSLDALRMSMGGS